MLIKESTQQSILIYQLMLRFFTTSIKWAWEAKLKYWRCLCLPHMVPWGSGIRRKITPMITLLLWMCIRLLQQISVEIVLYFIGYTFLPPSLKYHQSKANKFQISTEWFASKWMTLEVFSPRSELNAVWRQLCRLVRKLLCNLKDRKKKELFCIKYSTVAGN